MAASLNDITNTCTLASLLFVVKSHFGRLAFGLAAIKKLAKYHFSPYEYAVLQRLPAVVREEAFFLGWSRKEAYIKAWGKGLSIPLDQFDVSLTPGEPAALIASREDPQATACWSLHALAPGTGYAGALVVEGTSCRLSCWKWQW